MKVVFFHRKPRPNYNFSVEILFEQIRKSLPANIQWEVKQLRYFSEGFFKRLYISFEAALNQRDINHVTGDINFIAILLKRKRTVLTLLDMGIMNHPNPLARLILRIFWIVLPVKRSAVITTISEATKTELLKYVRVKPEKIKVVYVPISDLFKPAPKQFNKIKPVILQIGTKPNKNVIRLVRALQGIQCHLCIVGEVNNELLGELANANVEYSSFKNLPLEQVLDKYQSADVVSFVSVYEGFGMPIIEANAIGRVVVTSNILSMPEVAGNAAHLVNPYEVMSIRQGITKVIQDDDYREELIARGFVNRNRFDAVEIANQYAEIYGSLIS